MVQQHPNATAAGITTGIAVLIVYVAGLFGLPLPVEVAVTLGGFLTTTVLFVGRSGVRGIARRLWGGSGE